MKSKLQSLDKFLGKLQRMVEVLHEMHNDFKVHQYINQFYYMMKIGQLSVMRTKLEECHPEMCKKIEAECREVYCRWRKEVRWLNRYLKGSS